MRKVSRRFQVERLESRCLCAALDVVDQPTTVASVSLQDEASIDVSEVQGLRGAALEISFDHQRLQVDPRDVRAGSAWGGKGMSIANVDNDEGTINVFVFSARESELSHGSLVEIDFRRNGSEADGDGDGVLPLIDVNRLRLNDNEISFADTDSTLSENVDSGPTSLPKLSLQFKIAPEGEHAGATDWHHQEVADVSDVTANTAPSIEPPEETPNDNQDILLAVIEDQISDPSRFESNKDLRLHSGEVCKPLKIAGSQVDLAIDQWVGNAGILKGPTMPETEQTLVVFPALPAIADEILERHTRSLRSVGTETDQQPDNDLPDFSTGPIVVIRRGIGSAIVPKAGSSGSDATGPFNAPLSTDLLRSEFASLGIDRRPFASMYR